MIKFNKLALIVVMVLGIVACDDQSERTRDEQSKVIPHTETKVEQIKHSEKILQKEAPLDAESFCKTMNVETWFAFDEASAEPICHQVKFYQLKDYQCDISKHAFGLHEDAIYIEKGAHRIFAYPIEKQCLDALDVRDSNAP